ncbi:zinc finger protein 334-like [Daktulosphaira vitifoliae]|uniref:zinc finger protein 334-like n=1 Tax=Daktulosphaira vitifoliae TaxID=58002 RepID=UPI0021AAF357|nr:zinc finger protein 334-like [Daktulosphaira vitifoliae]
MKLNKVSCNECKYIDTLEKLFDCKHEFCKRCIDDIRRSTYKGEAYKCKQDLCMSGLPKGICLNCHKEMPVDKMFECQHTFCEDCIKYLKKEKTYYCPIDNCNTKVLLEICDKCKFINSVEKCFDCEHWFCNSCRIEIKQDAYTSKINHCTIQNCKSQLPKGNCLKCNKEKPLDNLFECQHKFCEDCIKFYVEENIHNCPIDNCNTKVIFGNNLFYNYYNILYFVL